MNPEISTHPTERPLTHVAVGVVHNQQGQVLFAQRPAGKPYAGWWEFPGGKLEAGETLAQGLARELKEELGITIQDCHHWLTQQFSYPHAFVNLQFCHVWQFTGDVRGLEGQAFAWGSLDAAPHPFLPAALPVLKAMQLPPVLRLSNAQGMGMDAWTSSLEKLSSGVVVVHEPHFEAAEVQTVFDRALKWKYAQPSVRTLLVSSLHSKDLWGQADGVHFTEPDLMALTRRPSHLWVGASASSRVAIDHAHKLGCEYVAVGRVATPENGRQKPEAQVMGWGRFGELAQGTRISIFAQGGLAVHHLPFAYAAGASGVMLKSNAWTE